MFAVTLAERGSETFGAGVVATFADGSTAAQTSQLFSGQVIVDPDAPER